jgi:hypothetical protein
MRRRATFLALGGSALPLRQRKALASGLTAVAGFLLAGSRFVGLSNGGTHSKDKGPGGADRDYGILPASAGTKLFLLSVPQSVV